MGVDGVADVVGCGGTLAGVAREGWELWGDEATANEQGEPDAVTVVDLAPESYNWGENLK